jgi:ADP-ribosylglycohydrolase
MLGAIVGDIIGSRFEWNNIKSKDFPLFTKQSRFTDDTVMTVAVAKALLKWRKTGADLSEATVEAMQELGRLYPTACYGGMFSAWIVSSKPAPYHSFGNGAAMRVSPVAYAGKTLDEVKSLARTVTAVTHDHPEGIKGAEATAVAVFLARTGKTITEIREYIGQEYYRIDFTLDEIRPHYRFDVTCQGTVPQALQAFFESNGFEDAVRNAISLGGDSDTLAAICGAVAEAYYGIPDDIREKASAYLDERFMRIIAEFSTFFRSYIK